MRERTGERRGVGEKCLFRIRRLAALGHEIRRPEADDLGDGIYELRVGFRGQNYRVLYFFHGTVASVLAHGLTKEDRGNATRARRCLRVAERDVHECEQLIDGDLSLPAAVTDANGLCPGWPGE